MTLLEWLKRLVGSGNGRDPGKSPVQPDTASERAVKAPLDEIQTESGESAEKED